MPAFLADAGVSVMSQGAPVMDPGRSGGLKLAASADRSAHAAGAPVSRKETDMNMIAEFADGSERYARGSDPARLRPPAHPTQRSTVMTCSDTLDKNQGSVPEQEFDEDQFLEQYAALEEGLALLQIQLRGMSETANRFGSLARHLRRSICPAARSPDGFKAG
jgi:hypothetical protein